MSPFFKNKNLAFFPGYSEVSADAGGLKGVVPKPLLGPRAAADLRTRCFPKQQPAADPAVTCWEQPSGSTSFVAAVLKLFCTSTKHVIKKGTFICLWEAWQSHGNAYVLALHEN